MNDREPFSASDRKIIDFLGGLYPDRSQLVERNRELSRQDAQRRRDLRSAREDREAQLRRSIVALGYMKTAAILLFCVVVAYLLAQHWTSKLIGLDGWLLLSVSIALLVLIDRREADLGRWIFKPNLKAQFWPTEVAIDRVCRSSRLSRRAIAIDLKGQVLR